VRSTRKYERPEARIHPPEEHEEFRLRQQREAAEAREVVPPTDDTPLADGSGEVIVGRNPILEALDSGRAVEKVFIQFGLRGPALNSIFKAAKRRGIPIQQAPREKIEQLGGPDTQGVVALVSATAYLELEELLEQLPKETTPFLLLLDEIEDPHNLGALVRSALCFGIHGTIIPKHHAATVNATTVKTSAGAALSMPIARVANLVQSITQLKEQGYRIIGTDAAGDVVLADADFSGPVALVIGNEGKGLRRLVREHCDVLVKIPMVGSFDSLNASVAGAIVMYEGARRRT
jgi:23S rRNA (guanosine2251-2'-O)-methyltransferase